MIDLFRLYGDRSFLCLSIRKKAKNKTPQLPLFPCATRFAGHPSKLALTSHTERGLLRNSDSRWPKAPINPALLGAADGALTPSERHRLWMLSTNLKNYASYQFAQLVVWRDKSHPITLSSGDKIRGLSESR